MPRSAAGTNQRPRQNGAPGFDIQRLRTGYGRRVVLRELSLTVPAGAVTAIVGPNACGKSTLLRTCGRLLRPMAGTVACYLVERRLPDLAAGAVALHPRGGVAFLSPHCWALPDDSEARHSDVTVVADREDLRARLVGQLDEHHAAPLFATLRAVAPYGVPAMRANYVDRLASAVLWVTEQLENADLARREVPALVALADPNARTGVLEIEQDGRRGVYLRRGGCCLSYRLPGGEKCDTCRLRPPEERVALLRRNLGDGTP